MKIRKYWLVAKTSLQSNLAYVSNFLFDILFYAFIVTIFVQLWSRVYGGANTISGYSLEQMIWYCIITEMVILSGGGAFQSLSGEIKGGGIAYLLSRPYNFILYQFSNSMGLAVIKLVMNAIAGVLLGVVFVRRLDNFSIMHIPFIILSMVLGILLSFFLQASIGLTAFWVEENSAFYWIYQKLILILGVFLPLEFLPEWLQGITGLLPMTYITYGPGKLAVDFSFSGFSRIIGMQLLYLALFVFITFSVYRKGVRMLNVNGG